MPEANPFVANNRRKMYHALVDEGRKRVIGIMAAILVTRHFKTPEDLFGTAQGNSPRSDAMIGAAVQWAERIMGKIDALSQPGARKGWPT
jgi:hypothetical protein